jgi:hypothetical protein
MTTHNQRSIINASHHGSKAVREVLNHMKVSHGITAAEAMLNLGMSSGSLSRRICDIEEFGVGIDRQRHVNPVTTRRYTRYAFQDAR